MVNNGLKPSNFKEWLWSAKILTTIVWILFPLGITYAVINLGAGVFTGDISYDVFFLILPIPLLYDIPSEVGMTLSIPVYFVIIPPLPLMIVLSLFTLYPAIYSTEKFFKKRGNANAVIEYRYLRRILFAFLIAEIAMILVLYFAGSAYTYLIDIYLRDINNQSLPSTISFLDTLLAYLYLIIFTLLPVPIFILLKLLLEHARKQFRFYYAKACFKIMDDKNSEADKAKYLLLGLGWYNKFVERVTQCGIDIEIMYPKIVSHSQLSNNILLDTIMDSFHNEDELKPMRHMLALLSCWKEGATLVKESLRTKIKESSELLIPIVTVIITIITTFFLQAPAPSSSGG